MLAVVSWGYWEAQVGDVRLRAVLGRPGLRRPMDLGVALFCAGLAATSQPWWQRVLWAALGVAWLVDAALVGRGAGEPDHDVS